MGSATEATISAADAGSLAGARVGRYELVYEIAAGGMASVYVARAHGVGGFERTVAIKVPHPHLRRDPEFGSMFLDEARLAARIHHPNVVGVLDFGDAGSLYLVMEYIEGDHLAALIRAASAKGQRLPVGVALRIVLDTLEGLHAAHELVDDDGNRLNIVHRDTSPQNILVGIDGISRITDFGIARAEARASVTRDGQVKGKLAYIAPEQLASLPVTRQADVFGTGVLLWEALVGLRLFRADSEAETVNRVLKADVPVPSSLVPDLPAALDAIVMKALARNQVDRFESAAAFADAIEKSGVPIESHRAVASCVEELLGESIALRRDAVTRLARAGAPRDPTVSAGHRRSAAIDEAETKFDVSEHVPSVQLAKQSRRWYVVAGALLVAALLVAVLARPRAALVSPASTRSTLVREPPAPGVAPRPAPALSNNPVVPVPPSVAHDPESAPPPSATPPSSRGGSSRQPPPRRRRRGREFVPARI